MKRYKDILSSLHKGTFQTDKHPDTLVTDLKEMYDLGYVDDEYNITNRGVQFLKKGK